MRIVQVIPGLALGGLERVATMLAVGLAERGETVVVCTAGSKSQPYLMDELRAAGVPVVRVPRPWATPRAQLRAAFALARVLRRERPDVVHAHNPAAALAVAAARVLARRRPVLVATYHGMVGGRAAGSALPVLRRCDLVVAIGPAAARELEEAGLDPRRLAVVPNGVEARAVRPREELRAELGVPLDAELVVTVGRYVAEKNQMLLLRALAILAPRRPRLRALVVGMGELEQDLRDEVQRLGLERVVQITGTRSDALDVTAAADVATLTSSREGLGLSLLEAMALGTPVVGTAVGGIPDAIEDGVSGLLVPADDPQALGAALERLLDGAELRAQLAAGGRARVAERFSASAMVDGYLAAYRAAIERH